MSSKSIEKKPQIFAQQFYSASAEEEAFTFNSSRLYSNLQRT